MKNRELKKGTLEKMLKVKWNLSEKLSKTPDGLIKEIERIRKKYKIDRKNPKPVLIS